MTGALPFDASSLAAVAASVAGDMDAPAPDVRDAAPADRRAGISGAFAAVIARGLEKRAGGRYGTLDEMATDLYGCLVQVRRREGAACRRDALAEILIHARQTH